jgi:hypothetical protein
MASRKYPHLTAAQVESTRSSHSAMRARCESPSNASYSRYGAVGITVCERWKKFENFLADMGPRPPYKTLDRYPNKDGDYEPGNCRWATMAEQSANRNGKRAHIVEFQGRAQSIRQWEIELGLPLKSLYQRIVKSKWPVDEALTRPFGAKRQMLRRYSISEIATACAEAGIPDAAFAALRDVITAQ